MAKVPTLQPWSPEAAKGLGNPWPTTPHDSLTWLNGAKIGAVPSDQLIRDAIDRGVIGVAWGQGRLQVATLIADHLAKIHEQAGDAAVSAWLNGSA